MSCTCNQSINCDPCAFCTPPGVTCLTTCTPVDPCPEKIDLSCVVYSGDNVGGQATTGQSISPIILNALDAIFPLSVCCAFTATATLLNPPAQKYTFCYIDDNVYDAVCDCDATTTTVTVYSIDNPLVVGSKLYSNVNLTIPAAQGLYGGMGQYIAVIPTTGEIISISQCIPATTTTSSTTTTTSTTSTTSTTTTTTRACSQFVLFCCGNLTGTTSIKPCYPQTNVPFVLGNMYTDANGLYWLVALASGTPTDTTYVPGAFTFISAGNVIADCREASGYQQCPGIPTTTTRTPLPTISYEFNDVGATVVITNLDTSTIVFSEHTPAAPGTTGFIQPPYGNYRVTVSYYSGSGNIIHFKVCNITTGYTLYTSGAITSGGISSDQYNFILSAPLSANNIKIIVYTQNVTLPSCP